MAKPTILVCYFICLHKKINSCKQLQKRHNTHRIVPVAQTKNRPKKAEAVKTANLYKYKQLF